MKNQRGYIQAPSTGELFGCFAVVAAFFIIVGVGLALLAPKVWACFKPWLASVLL